MHNTVNKELMIEVTQLSYTCAVQIGQGVRIFKTETSERELFHSCIFICHMYYILIIGGQTLQERAESGALRPQVEDSHELVSSGTPTYT